MATLGFSAVLKLGDGGGGSLVALDEAVNIKLPSYEPEVSETTHLTSSNRIRTFIPGMVQSGNFSFELNYNKADYVRLLAVQAVTKNWEIDGPIDSQSASLTVAFSAILLKAEVELVADQVVKIKCEGKVTGAHSVT